MMGSMKIIGLFSMNMIKFAFGVIRYAVWKRTSLCLIPLTAAGFISSVLTGCGDPGVTIDRGTYEPKIVINGFIYPGENISRIKIARNFAVGDSINLADEALSNAEVWVTRLSDGNTVRLSYEKQTRSFEDNSVPVQILPVVQGESYRLDVKAAIDGIDLQASSTTTVPSNRDFGIDESRFADTLIYNWRDAFGIVNYPKVYYAQGGTGYAADAAFYVMALTSLDGTEETFILDNPFGFDVKEAKERNEDFDIEELKYRYQWARPENQVEGNWSVFEIYWFNLWFYGRYRLILYAGDKNFYHFFMTSNRLMDMDGNLHEPEFDIEGDGIGVFGSALKLTRSFYVK